MKLFLKVYLVFALIRKHSLVGLNLEECLSVFRKCWLPPICQDNSELCEEPMQPTFLECGK